MPPKARVKHANQHDKRHDAGLAAPGKRISKDKEKQTDRLQSSTNGTPLPSPSNPNGRSFQSTTPPLQQQSPSLTSGGGSLRSDSHLADSELKGLAADRAAAGGNHDCKEHKESDTVDDEEGNMDYRLLSSNSPTAELACSREPSTIKSLVAQASSSISLAATILSACPLRDAIAILILLLSIPPSITPVIYGLFASLTFVPPSVGFSWGSWSILPSFSDWFHATPGGGPSPFTILFSDLVMVVIHMACPLRLQNIFMDLAQAVIAISLSGAAAGTGTSTRNVVFCSAIIVVSHLARYKNLQVSGHQYLASTLRSVGFDVGENPLQPSESSSTDPVGHGWMRLLLGCHILAQGLLTLLRRWFADANQKRQINSLDAEQAALTDSGKLAMLNLEVPDNGPNGTAEGKAITTSSSVPREAKDKALNRRKRRQANQVRSQQPLWAALASTKVTFMKEMEQKSLAEDKKEAMARTALEGGSRTSIPTDDRIWILDIGPTSINFRAELFASPGVMPPIDEDKTGQSSGIDKQKPFFVRLNGADWGSTRIAGAAVDGSVVDADHSTTNIWLGEIHGLSPLTKYLCEFIRTKDQSIIFSTNLITLLASGVEHGRPRAGTAPRGARTDELIGAVSVPAAAPHQSLRPMSPTSTLKQSILAADVKREDSRNKLKRTRKDLKASATTIRKELDQLQAKAASAGGQDEKARQRILQLKQHVKQAEDAVDAIKSEHSALGDIPEEDLDALASRRKSYDGSSEARDAAKTELDNARTEANKALAAIQTEITSVRQKRERLSTRRTRLHEQYDKLVTEQNADDSARQSQMHRREQRQAAIEQFKYWTHVCRDQSEEYTIRANEIYAQIQQTQAELASQFPPPTPEGNLPGTNGPRGPAMQPFDFAHFGGLPAAHQPMLPQKWGGTQPQQRQRSSSMLSGYSGFTDDLDVGGATQNGNNGHLQYHGAAGGHHANGSGRKNSSGAGSSGGSVDGVAPPAQQYGNWSGMRGLTGSPTPVVRSGSSDLAGRGG